MEFRKEASIRLLSLPATGSKHHKVYFRAGIIKNIVNQLMKKWIIGLLDYRINPLIQSTVTLKLRFDKICWAQ